ncbi:ABC-2 type transport system permease protein [Alkalihalobacillus xiaoxiensis]|uniref:ABC-2 type transport system permease protein n=1 Tax=Shouchella xiaoxiensis TaxID=766895 RepID=A0ABS2SND3_9BACI|nr:ABC transporter permease [Shouchella xiaoxiensis]MBM7837032.1 ABC-2 type transport system permease protein [Shouchella xiaoxiensis]
MLNYLKSEQYRLLRKKATYILPFICFLLITAAAVVLILSDQQMVEFPYATNQFFYANVIGGIILILIVAFLFNLLLTGNRELAVLKQTVSFGIGRTAIFYAKLLVTLGYFLLVCALGLTLVIALAEGLFAQGESLIQPFLVASANMLPLVLSGFIAVHSLRMIQVGEVYVIVLVLVVYRLSGDLIRAVSNLIPGLDGVYQYAPSTLLNDNLTQFGNQSAQLDFRVWLTGLVLAALFLAIGHLKFLKQPIE